MGTFELKNGLAALMLASLLGACSTSALDVRPVAAVDPAPRADVAAAEPATVSLAEEEHAAASKPVETFAYAGNAKPRFGDADPFDFGRKSPHGHAVHGIDVAKYQGSVDFARARASGVSFAFMKATEGGDRVDDRFAENWRTAKSAGLPRGAYHFYYFCTSAADQARWFIRNVPKDASALPPVLDMEWNPQSPTCKKRPPASVVRSEMKTFLSMIERHYGKKPVIYTTPDFFEDNGLASFKGYSWWLRSTNDHPDAKYDGQAWVFWQYTGTGRVPGVKGDADINVFRGDARAWRSWLAANAD